MKKTVTLIVFYLVAVVACATSPLGRKQLKLFPEEQIDEMGVAAYQQLQQQTPTAQDTPVTRYVQCIADAVTAQVNGDTDWEVSVFKQDEVNAFALPGGKIGVYEGLLEVTENQAQLAAVIGHEVAHVIAGHSNERMSTEFATQAGLDVLAALAGGPSPEKQQIFSLLGLGAQVGIILPYSRAHETEADLLGIDYMAKAGFDPRESVELWRNMAKAGGEAPAEFLSTHPTTETRMENLQERMPEAMELYRQALAQGQQPQCERFLKARDEPEMKKDRRVSDVVARPTPARLSAG